MGTVTGLTAERMLEIEAASVVSGEVVAGELILTKHDATTIDAGYVAGEGLLPGGTVGQIPRKTSSTDFATSWQTLDASMVNETVALKVMTAAERVALAALPAAKQDVITGGATTITGADLTADVALISNGVGKVAASATTAAELAHVHGVTADIQGQIDAKGPLTLTVGLGYATSGLVAINFLTTTGTWQFITSLTGNLTLTTSNRATGRHVKFVIQNGGTIRTLTFPATWAWVGGAAPANIAASKIGVLELVCFGANDSDIIATWKVQA